MTESGPGPPDPEHPPSTAPPGWYRVDSTGRYAWWDGFRWTDAPYPAAGAVPQAVPDRFLPQQAPGRFVPPPPAMKSSGVAAVWTFFFPGVGHLYLGDYNKAMPYLIINIVDSFFLFVALVVPILLILVLPVSFIVWVVMLILTLPNIGTDTDEANARALARYRQMWGV
jgi:hypothetical protein